MIVDICKPENLGSECFVGIKPLMFGYEIYPGNFKIPDRPGFFGCDFTLDPNKLFVGRQFPDKRFAINFEDFRK